MDFGTAAAQKEADKAKQTTPFLGEMASHTVKTVGGSAQLTGGLLSGNSRDIKQGGKTFGQGVLDAVTAKSIRSINDPPPKQYLGGSQDALDQRRTMYTSGIQDGSAAAQSGIGIAGQGAAMLGQAADQAGANRSAAFGMMGQGQGIGMAGIGAQAGALNSAIGLAGQSQPSLAAIQMQQGLGQAQAAQNAMAADARGGNQAAAMRNAGYQGAQMANNVVQQTGAIRAQEQIAQRQQQIQAQQYAAGMYGQQAGQGFGLQAQGLGAANQATGLYGEAAQGVGSIGLGIGQIGTQQQGIYTGALGETDRAQLDADTKNASAAQAAKGGIMSLAGNVISMYTGGGKGGKK